MKCDASGDIDVVFSVFPVLPARHGGARTGVGKQTVPVICRRRGMKEKEEGWRSGVTIGRKEGREVPRGKSEGKEGDGA